MLRFSENVFWRALGWSRSVVWRFAWCPDRYSWGRVSGTCWVGGWFGAGSGVDVSSARIPILASPARNQGVVTELFHFLRSIVLQKGTTKTWAVSTALLQCPTTVKIRLRTMHLWCGIAAVVLGRICMWFCRGAVCNLNLLTLPYVIIHQGWTSHLRQSSGKVALLVFRCRLCHVHNVTSFALVSCCRTDRFWVIRIF